MRAQARPSHRIGGIEVTPLWDGPLPSSLGKIIDPSHVAEAKRLIASAPPDALIMNVYAFLLKRDDHFALIDTGAGRLVNPDLGKLISALRAVGVTAEQIERIFLTHVHRDHYGGLADAEDKAAFPNAEVVLHEKEAHFWLNTRLENMPQRARRYVDSARQFLSLYAGRLRTAYDGEDIQGVTARFAPGHTPGHTCWLVQSGGRSLLALGDLLHIAYIHLPAPHIAMEYDLDPGLALQTRRGVLDWVAGEGILVAGAHLPSPGIGAVARHGGGWAFEPDL